MPFKSEAQRRFMYAKHPEIAKRWTKEESVKNTGYREAVKRKLHKVKT